MGLFNDLSISLRESPGRVLWQQLQSHMLKLENMSDSVRNTAFMGYLHKREQLLASLENASRDGRIKLGVALQRKGHKLFDLNMSEGVALWLAGAWLESMERPGTPAIQTHEKLEELAGVLTHALSNQSMHDEDDSIGTHRLSQSRTQSPVIVERQSEELHSKQPNYKKNLEATRFAQEARRIQSNENQKKVREEDAKLVDQRRAAYEQEMRNAAFHQAEQDRLQRKSITQPKEK